MEWRVVAALGASGCLLVAACGSDGGGDASADGATGGASSGAGGRRGEPIGPGTGPVAPPAPACDAADDPADAVATPELVASLGDRWHESWLGSPVVADLDGDGTAEILAARHGLLLGWHLDGSVVFRAEVDGRCWASPAVADFVPDHPGLEIAQSSDDSIHLFGSDGEEMPGFPAAFRGELRSLAAGDVNGDGSLDLVAVTTRLLEMDGQCDIIFAVQADGSPVPGFPANTSGASGCDDACYVYNGYDQNVALGDVDGDGRSDVFATQDNAYLSLHQGDGTAFDAADFFEDRTKFHGVRGLHDYDLAKQGWANDEDTALQAHYTNSAPAIVDIDGDGRGELIVLASVQNAAQTEREQGVALWALNEDGSRPDGWETPVHFPDYLSGLWDYGDNIVAITNQVSVADIDPTRDGVEFVFAGFDGRIHAVDSKQNVLWDHTYTTDPMVGTAGVAIADLSGDGTPEIVFSTYSTSEGISQLVILDAGGNELHAAPLPKRGSMSVPTVADTDGDGAPEIVVSLKDGGDDDAQVLVFAVASARDNCLAWPTGRGSVLRDGYVRPSD